MYNNLRSDLYINGRVIGPPDTEFLTERSPEYNKINLIQLSLIEIYQNVTVPW